MPKSSERLLALHGLLTKRGDGVQGAELIFYGDSITWCFTGENPSGVVTAQDRERSAVFQRHFGRFRSKIMAIPGVGTSMPSSCSKAYNGSPISGRQLSHGCSWAV